MSSSSCTNIEAIDSLKKLQELTTCGLTAQSVQHAVASVAVPNQQLTYWPPALCQFTALTSINLSGNSLTFIPQSIKNLQGLQQLLVSRNALGCLPPEIGALTALTELGVGANSISKLPDGLCKLTGLKVLNAWGNQLTSLPDGFGALTSLIRLGLKGNQLAALPDSFTQLSSLVELFLTDNKLTTLPAGFGNLRSLVKLQASYNPLESLPQDLWQLPALELFRLAVGNLPQWPARVGSLPRLAWCSLGSNPAAAAIPAPPADMHRVRLSELTLGSKLGQGASGEVFNGVYNGKPVAVKIFLPGASPDGSTTEEIAITCHNIHPHLTRVLAVVVDDNIVDDDPASSPHNTTAGQGSSDLYAHVKGLVMELVVGKTMADRPTSQHLLRCKWPADHTYSGSQTASICSGLASALAYLHSLGVCHGDVYAHNIMLQGTTHAVLCDFGAAFCYDSAAAGGGGGGISFWEAMEIRAFGLFMLGLLQQTLDDRADSSSAGAQAGGRGGDGAGSGCGELKQQLEILMQQCLTEDAAARPSFAELHQRLAALVVVQE